MTDAQGEAERVVGERDARFITRTLSLQSRVSNVLAVGLMCVFGLGSLTWYYAHAFARQGGARRDAEAAVAGRAQGDLPLPSLGPLTTPVATREPVTLAEVPLVESPLAETASPHLAATAINAAAMTPVVKSAAELAAERALSGAVFVPADRPNYPDGNALIPPGSPSVAQTEGDDLSPKLQAAHTVAVRARILPTRRLLLGKGAFIDCTLETAIDSTLPGMTTCVMATDAFSVDGSVVLLARGTKLIGETRGQVQQGAARVFVLWTEARTPEGIVVPLDSPGADELGRSGLAGKTDRHFWQRFGAALLVSVVDGAVQSAVQSARGGSGTVIINPSSSQDVLTEILKGTVAIAPTVTKQNGDRIQVLVARDVDFRSVYELRAAERPE